MRITLVTLRYSLRSRSARLMKTTSDGSEACTYQCWRRAAAPMIDSDSWLMFITNSTALDLPPGAPVSRQ